MRTREKQHTSPAAPSTNARFTLGFTIATSTAALARCRTTTSSWLHRRTSSGTAPALTAFAAFSDVGSSRPAACSAARSTSTLSDFIFVTSTGIVSLPNASVTLVSGYGGTSGMHACAAMVEGPRSICAHTGQELAVPYYLPYQRTTDMSTLAKSNSTSALLSRPERARVKREVRALFKKYDAASDGFIDQDDLKHLLGDLMGKEPNKIDLLYALKAMDTSDDGRISFDEMVKYWEKMRVGHGGSVYNRLLVKDTVGAPRTSTYDLPPIAFKFGKGAPERLIGTREGVCSADYDAMSCVVHVVAVPCGRGVRASGTS